MTQSDENHEEMKNVKETLGIDRVPDKSNRPLQIANFAYNYKYECFSNLEIALMASDIHRDFDLYGEHPGFILPRMNSNFTIINMLKSLIWQKMLSNKKCEYLDLLWQLCDYSPSAIVDFYKKSSEKPEENLSLSSFWSFNYFTKDEITKKRDEVIKKEKYKETEINKDIMSESLTQVKIVKNLNDVNEILNPSKRLCELKEALKDKKLDDNKKTEYQNEVRSLIFGKPVFFYLFLFEEPHADNIENEESNSDIKWQDILPESQEEVNSENEYKASYALTAILFYHDEHYKVIIIHDVPVLISNEGNVVNPSLPSEGVTIIGLLYSHVGINVPSNLYFGMNPFKTLKNVQKDTLDPEYLNAIYHYFDKIKDIDGFDLINAYIRFPAFYCFKSADPQIKDLVEDIIEYDVYIRFDENQKKKTSSTIKSIFTNHALIPLWAISITNYLEKKNPRFLRESLLYIDNIPFMIKFTHYLKDNISEDDIFNQSMSLDEDSFSSSGQFDRDDLLIKAFDIVFGKGVEASKNKDYNYNDIFPSSEIPKTDREDIIYKFNKAIVSYVLAKIKIDEKDKNNKPKILEIFGDIIKKQKDYNITQDFLEYQRMKTRSHPYL